MEIINNDINIHEIKKDHENNMYENENEYKNITFIYEDNNKVKNNSIIMDINSFFELVKSYSLSN